MTPMLPMAVLSNAGFYQAAASLFAVLLLSGVVAELRETRDHDDDKSGDPAALSLYVFLALSVLVLIGELAALTVLLREDASPFLQAVVGLALIGGLIGVPSLAFISVMRRAVESATIVRGALRAAKLAMGAAAVAIAGFIGQALLSGQPGVGTPTKPSVARPVDVKVVKWAAALAPRKQWQLKLQLRFRNPGPRSLNIGLAHVALVMSQFDASRWTPPRLSPGPIARPYRTAYRGLRVWVVPANAEGTAENLTRTTFTFATHWNASVLAGGKTFQPINRRRGTVTFYVPRMRTDPQVSGVIGIAYVTTPNIAVIAPPERWGPRTVPSAF